MMGLGLRIVVDRCSGRSWWNGGSGVEFQWWLKCLLGLLGVSGGGTIMWWLLVMLLIVGGGCWLCC